MRMVTVQQTNYMKIHLIALNSERECAKFRDFVKGVPIRLAVPLQGDRNPTTIENYRIQRSRLVTFSAASTHTLHDNFTTSITNN